MDELAAVARERRGEIAIVEHAQHRIGEILRAVCDDQVATGDCLERACHIAGSDDGGPARHRFEYLELLPAAGPHRCDGDGRLREVRMDAGDRADHAYPRDARGEPPQPRRGAGADEAQLRRRTHGADARHLRCEPHGCVDVREVAEVADERDCRIVAGVRRERKFLRIDPVVHETHVRRISERGAIARGTHGAGIDSPAQCAFVTFESSRFKAGDEPHRAAIEPCPARHVERKRIDEIDYARQIGSQWRERTEARELDVDEIEYRLHAGVVCRLPQSRRRVQRGLQRHRAGQRECRAREHAEAIARHQDDALAQIEDLLPQRRVAAAIIERHQGDGVPRREQAQLFVRATAIAAAQIAGETRSQEQDAHRHAFMTD
ncbi:MAG TPA: hypothetical protein VFS55_13345 [Dokdonella sp.]|nr:hypothetical protein [Dokdonella sp.]